MILSAEQRFELNNQEDLFDILQWMTNVFSKDSWEEVSGAIYPCLKQAFELGARAGRREFGLVLHKKVEQICREVAS